MDENQSHIIEGLRRGRENAWRKLFKTYYRPLTIFAMERVGDLDTARDITQSLFVRLFEKRESLSINSSLQAYLYRAVHNRCMHYLEKKGNQNTSLEEHAPWMHSGNPTEEEIRRKETQNRIYEIVDSLPKKCREVFLMSRVEGLENGEIATRLKLSKRTVETQISKALKVLREGLN